MLHSKLSPVHYGRRWASSVVPNDRRRGSVLSNDCHWALVGPMIGGGVQLWFNGRHSAPSAVSNGRWRHSAVAMIAIGLCCLQCLIDIGLLQLAVSNGRLDWAFQWCPMSDRQWWWC